MASSERRCPHGLSVPKWWQAEPKQSATFGLASAFDVRRK